MLYGDVPQGTTSRNQIPFFQPYRKHNHPYSGIIGIKGWQLRKHLLLYGDVPQGTTSRNQIPFFQPYRKHNHSYSGIIGIKGWQLRKHLLRFRRQRLLALERWYLGERPRLFPIIRHFLADYHSLGSLFDNRQSNKMNE